MKHLRLYEEYLNERRKDSTLPPVDFDWKKAGSRWHFTIPFAEMKSRALGKPEFKTTNDPKPIEVEQFFWKFAYIQDAQAHAKILKGFKKYGPDYKHAGARAEEFEGWIVDAMVGQGSMVQM